MRHNIMVSEDMIRHASSNSNNIGGTDLCGNSDANDITEPEKAVDSVENGIFTMEDLGVENRPAHLEKDSSAQPSVSEVVESVSISQFSEVDAQHLRNGNDSLNIEVNVDQVKEVGIGERQGDIGPQEECNSKDSSVRVIYSSLPSRSKRKLEEVLRDWSDWHAKECSKSEDQADSLDSGEETYFPALHVGSDKPSTVSFSMDVRVSKRQRKESVSLNQELSPLYDREFALGLDSEAGGSEERGIDLREAPRCFNCGSYNHPLSGCMKPVNRAAVNSARKEFQNKKNVSGGPRVPTRYYQDSPGGKFDGIKPGALSAETRKLMGLGELDPPPWLNRMRELGYPPGYLDAEEEDQPSGISIFGDETQNVDLRNDPPLGVQNSEKKRMIDFPGLNAPIPENANMTLWATPQGPAVPDYFPNRPDSRWNFAQDSMAIRNIHGPFGLRNPIEGPPPPFGLGSPPTPHHPYNYRPSDPFSPVGVPIPGSPHYGRPFMHHHYGSF